MPHLVAALLLAPVLVSGSAPGSTVELVFNDPDIVESSGLVVVASPVGEALFVTTNDSGDTGRIFGVDPATGDTVGVSTWSADPVDVEALAPAGPGEVWVGDIGDNDAERDSVSVARVPIGRGDRSADDSPVYELVYPAGARDAESLLVDPDGRLLVVTKGLLGGEFLRAEQALDAERPNPLESVGVALPFATDGAFFPDGRHLVVRGYGSAVVYAYPSLDEVASFSLPDQEQGEGIAVDSSGSVFVSSEGETAEVLRVRLPRDVRRAIEPTTPGSPGSPGSPTPSEPRSDNAETTDDPDDPDDQNGGLPWLIAGTAALVVSMGLVLVLVVRRPRGLRRPRG